VCNNNVTNRTGGLKRSEMCTRWFHLNYVNISKKKFNLFDELGDKARWFCSGCDVEVMKFVQRSKDNIGNESMERSDVDIKSVLGESMKFKDDFVNLSKRVAIVEDF
jgi:hypothetical protein